MEDAAAPEITPGRSVAEWLALQALVEQQAAENAALKASLDALEAKSTAITPVVEVAKAETPTPKTDDLGELGEHITNLGKSAIEVLQQEGARLADRLIGVAADSLQRIQAGGKKK